MNFMVKITSLVLGALIVLAACTGKGGGQSPNSNAGRDERAPTPTSAGTFHATGAADRATVAKATSCTADSHLDEGLQPGQKYTIIDKWTAQDGGFGGADQYIKEVLNIDIKASTINFKDTYNYKGQQGWITEACKYELKKGETRCDIVTSSRTLKGDSHAVTSQKSCYAAYDDKSTFTSTEEAGIYTMKDGRRLNAIRIATTTSGPIECNLAGSPGSTKVGQGIATSVRILTRDIPETQGSTCGAAPSVFWYDEVKDTNGTVISVKKYEVVLVQ